jgi:membrane associated rhomboid family serine protease
VDPLFIYILVVFLESLFLFPIRDRRDREHGFPWMALTIVLINVFIHAGLNLLFYLKTQALPDEIEWIIALYPYMEVSSLKLQGEGLGALSSLTSFFLHADWFHLGGNMFILWFFGRKIEDATGPVQFLLFYLFCGFTASFVSVAASNMLMPMHARVPALGASGAISGLMGAYLFLYSDQRILTFIAVFCGSDCCVPVPIPMWLPAWVFLIYNFLHDALIAQLVVELAKIDIPFSTGVGVFAHLGGAMAGVVGVFFFLHPDVLARRR